MDFLCPEIERLVSCYTCGTQALPPYQLCAEAHVACQPCTKYQSRCACGCRFLRTSNTTLDWLVSGMKLRCKYRTNAADGGAPAPGRDDCADGWYAVQELRDHYRTGCARNSFTCPLQDCGHVARVDTITDHYETEHGPFPPLVSDDYQQSPNSVVFTLSNKKQTEVVRKIFNGYFLFVVKPQRRRRSQDTNSPLSMQNINPSDMFEYTYTALQDTDQKVITVILSMAEMHSSPTRNRM